VLRVLGVLAAGVLVVSCSGGGDDLDADDADDPAAETSVAAVGPAPVPPTDGTTAGSVVTVEPMTDGPPTQEQLDAARIDLQACALVGTNDVEAAVGVAVGESAGSGVPGRTGCHYDDSAGEALVTVELLTDDVPPGDERPTEVFDALSSAPGAEALVLDGDVEAVWVDGSLHALVGTSLVTVDVGPGSSDADRRRSAETLAAVAITRL
jgi:hypothetical protein